MGTYYSFLKEKVEFTYLYRLRLNDTSGVEIYPGRLTPLSARGLLVSVVPKLESLRVDFLRSSGFHHPSPLLSHSVLSLFHLLSYINFFLVLKFCVPNYHKICRSSSDRTICVRDTPPIQWLVEVSDQWITDQTIQYLKISHGWSVSFWPRVIDMYQFRVILLSLWRNYIIIKVTHLVPIFFKIRRAS